MSRFSLRGILVSPPPLFPKYLEVYSLVDRENLKRNCDHTSSYIGAPIS